jgi:monoamine oxidase
MAFPQIPQAVPKPKVVVIGAGLAGLTTAYRMMQNNIDVEVYEAKPRVGGRVHTALIKNSEQGYSVAELGGQNITDGGVAENIINLAKELKIELIGYSRDFSSLYYDGSNFYDYHDLLKTIKLSESDIVSKLKELENTKQSMHEVLDTLFPNQADLKKIFTFFLTAYEGSIPSKLSTYHNIKTFEYMMLGGISEAHNIKGVKPTLELMSLKGGNANLPLKLAEKLGKHLHLNKILRLVSYNSNDQILLSFQDGSTSLCDKLILAIPTPVYSDINFDSVIDQEQLNLIKQIEYGTNSKILIPIGYKNISHNSLFSDNMSAFFNDDGKLFNMYFINDDGLGSFKDKLYGQKLLMLKKGYNNSNFITEEPVWAKEEQMIKYNYPVAKSWVADPFTKGSYSNYNVALGKKIDEFISYKGIKVKKIFAPVSNRIFFVGEHATILPEIGTMEAAVESGERIAKLFL